MEREVKINDINNPRAHRGTVASTRTKKSGALRRQSQPNLFIKAQDIFFLCLRNWKWFVLTTAICLGYTYYQLKKTPNQYMRTASIMIKGDDRSVENSMALKALGVETNNRNVSNELMAMTSNDVASQIAQRLGLDIEYYHEGSFHNQLVYGHELPVKITFHDINDFERVDCLLELFEDGQVRISNLKHPQITMPSQISLKLGQTINTPMGQITVEPTEYYRQGLTDRLLVQRIGFPSAANLVHVRLYASIRNTSASLIDLVYYDVSIERAEDVLKTLVNVYNDNWIEDRNKITESTNQFIAERIAIIEKELGDVENTIADYKSENLILDVNATGESALSVVRETEKEAQVIDNKLYMIEYIREFINNPANANHLIPANTGIGSSMVESQIGEYNATLLQRNSHLAHTSEQNPLVIDLDEKLDIIRGSIIQSMDNEILLLTNERNSLSEKHNEAIATVTESPRKSIYVRSIERQQSVKESLYTFMLQRREENELSQAFTAYNSRLIEPPHGSMTPISPVPGNKYAMALLLGLAIPAVFLIIKESFNTVVRGRKDIEMLSVPFVGEIPLDSQSDRRAKQIAKEKKKRHKNKRRFKEPATPFVVVEKSRNVMNEAFRVVRSNLEFILGFESGHHVIMLTSMNPSSGKTFITANLASSLGINNKRVIAVDLDLRKGSLSKYVNKPPYGVSNYLSGQVEDYKSLIISTQNVDILPCGTLPPNPTELLYTPAFTNLIENLKSEYDYVFLDCPPVEVVADAAIINRYSDMTLFVIRAQLMDKSFLADIEQWYEEKRFNNLSVILNGTTDAFSRYGYHKYGYRYGYHYGNYGYGYGNDKK